LEVAAVPYYRTEITAGRTIEVIKSYSRRIGDHKPRGGRDKPTQEEMQQVNRRNAETRLRRLINTNFGYGDYHLVLTYRKDQRPDPAEARKKITKFLRQLRRTYKKIGEELKYIVVTEYEKKAIHHHLIINGVDANINKIVRDCWEWGSPHFTPLDDTGQYKELAAYFIKETAETYKKKDGGARQRYSCSRNLVKPVTKTTVIEKASKWIEDPKPKKGYYIDKDSTYNGTDWSGRPIQYYTMIKLPDPHGG
jgi:RNA processing factor Prp31